MDLDEIPRKKVVQFKVLLKAGEGMDYAFIHYELLYEIWQRFSYLADCKLG